MLRRFWEFPRDRCGVGIGDVGVGVWPADLLAYRQEWEPFIAAHLALWRHMNELLEGIPDAQKCPAGIFTDSQIQNLDPTMRSFCASLALTRMYTSDTHPLGILTQWNAWANKSSAEVLAGAAAPTARRCHAVPRSQRAGIRRAGSR